MSPLVLGENLGVFINTLTADDKYRVQDCKNLPFPIQMQFSQFLMPFLEYTSNFRHL